MTWGVMILTAAVVVVVVKAAAAADEGEVEVLLPKEEVPESSTVEVRLKQGVILARREEVDDDASGGRRRRRRRYIYSFKGIPFAKPPVGDLRFRDPVPHGAWSGRRNGSFVPPFCPQLSLEASLKGKTEVIGEEDCLYLNVFTPKLGTTAGLPVMVWIHGGAFVSGGSEDHDPRPLLTKDVVIVVLQYRLGTLGFLSTEDSVLPGNLGLKDQTLALRWVQDNIRDLGGDPARVTIFGVSAGGASAHYQMLTPHAKGLFSRAILQSGTALCPWALREDHRQVALRIGEHLNCSGVNATPPDANTTQLLACLQEAPLHDIVLTPTIFSVWNSLPWVMAPRVDGVFIPDHPAALVRSGRYNHVDLMTGVTRDEGSVYASIFLSNETSVGELERDFEVAGPLAMIFGSWDEAPSYLARRAFYRYLAQATITHDKAQELTQMISDRFFKVCNEDTAMFHTRASTGQPLQEIPLQEPLEVPLEQPLEGPLEEPLEQPLQEPLEEPLEQPLEQPLEPLQEPLEPLEEPLKVPLEEPLEEPLEGPLKVPLEEPLEEPLEGPLEQPLEPLEGPLEEPLQEPLEPLEEPLEQPLERNVYRYELRHRGQNSWADLFNSTPANNWVAHGDDVQYLFHTLPVIMATPLHHPADLFLRHVLLALWTNFATTGNPTPDGSLGFRWWPTTESHQWYLALTTTPTMKDDTPVEVTEFWRNLPTKMNKLLYPERFMENGTCTPAGLCLDQ
ncbi:venom carboxylesterase-6-like isoform X3 [Panulirus ornatus]|uniref:venom carboxylesterase-6-like isoform X3 n=1 Tax=Panulirus ornatus TaxID=150431 RepID=UPI003A887BB4